MSEADSLRMVAEVVDKFSGPLRSLRDNLASIKASGARQVSTELETVGRTASSVAGTVRGQLAPAIGSLGAASLSVTSALVGVGAALWNFSRATATLQGLSNATGITVERLRLLEAVGQRFNIAPESMDAGVKHFAKKMDEVKRQYGEFHGWLNSQARADPGMNELLTRLHNSKSVDEQVGWSLDAMSRIKDLYQRQNFAREFFNDEALASIKDPKELREQATEAMKALGSMPAEAAKKAAEAQKAYARTIAGLRETLRGFRDEVGVTFLPVLSEAAKGVQEFLRENGGKIRDDLKAWFKGVNWSEVIADIREIASAIASMARGFNTAVQATTGWKTLIEALLVLKLAGFALRITGIAGAIRGLTAAAAGSTSAAVAPWLLRLLGLGATAGGAAGIVAATAAILGLRAVAEERRHTIIPEANQELERLRVQRDTLQEKLAGLTGTAKDRVQERLELTNRQMRELEERIKNAVKNGITEGMKDGATVQQNALTGAPGGIGALIHRASLGGTGSFGAAPGPARQAVEGARRFFGTGNAGNSGAEATSGVPRIPRAAPSNKMEEVRGGARAAKAAVSREYSNELGSAIKQSAKDLGVNPQDLGTAISYETAGTFDKWKRGPTTKWGTHRGYIQWGEPQAKKYGVTAETSVGDQMKAVTRYLRDAGVRPGMGLEEIYSAINAGRVGLMNRSDRPGYTVSRHVQEMRGPHGRIAARLLAQSRNAGSAETSSWNGTDWKDKTNSLGQLIGGQAAKNWRDTIGTEKRADFSEAVRELKRKAAPGDLSLKDDPSIDLLRRARRSGVLGSAPGFQANGTVNVHLEGFPRGTKAKTETEGGLFKEVRLNRGRSMALASEEA